MGNCIKKLLPARPDGTAMSVAALRYIELFHPDRSKILVHDPYVSGFVFGAALIRRLGYKKIHSKLSEKVCQGVHESVICRQVFIDSQVTKAVENGATQIVILGSGYDNRFYRLDCIREHSEKLTLIEVDQPEVQKLKKYGLKQMGVINSTNVNDTDGSSLPVDSIESYAFTNVAIDEKLIEAGKLGEIQLQGETKNAEKACVHFCPCNFETMTFEEQLKKTKFDSTKKTFFILEGLSQYVEKSALAKTINTIDNLCKAPGSQILVTYVDARSYDVERVGEICGDNLEQVLELIEIIGRKKEPWVTGFNVDEKSSTFGLKDWLIENTKGNFCENYIDQGWEEFCGNDLKPIGRHMYQYGKKAGEPIPKWGMERHACITRK